MIALYIIAGILVFLGLLVILPVSVRIGFDSEFVLKVYYSGIKVFDTNKTKSKKHKKDHEKSAKKTDGADKEKAELFIKKDFHRMGKTDFIKYYAAVLRDVLGKVLNLLKHFHVKVFDFTLAVGSPDAYDTALQFGIVSAAVNPVLLLLFKYTRVKAKHINIYADFVGDSYIFKTDINFSVSLVFLLISAVKLLKIYKSLKDGTYKTENSKTEDTSQKEKSVKTDERR